MNFELSSSTFGQEMSLQVSVSPLCRSPSTSPLSFSTLSPLVHFPPSVFPLSSVPFYQSISLSRISLFVSLALSIPLCLPLPLLPHLSPMSLPFSQCLSTSTSPLCLSPSVSPLGMSLPSISFQSLSHSVSPLCLSPSSICFSPPSLPNVSLKGQTVQS